MKRYYTFTVKKLVNVQHLVTIEYLQMGADFSYPEEIHDFYEFVFVEKGKIFCKTDEGQVSLEKHDFFLISPNTAHSYCVQNQTPSTVVIVCFKSNSGIIATAKGVHHLEDELIQLINNILSEAKETFVFPLDKKLTLNDHPRLGSQQLIENYIEELLIKLVQTATYQREIIQVMSNLQDIRKSIVKEIKQLLNDHIYTKITLSDISRQLLYSKTYLNDIFKDATGMTIMHYYQHLKVQKARQHLEKQESVYRVAEQLNFDTPQYFARIFKQKTGMTPTEYKRQHKIR
ncbi:MAG: helix-turn-helix transcriptional regulator [Oscillospiraceae bacterium]|nr:helix-turn-helix transcriptional regulator [Oscillospiraceae bacterium]